MKRIQLRTKLKLEDIWFSHPGIGSVIYVSGIDVPEELESKGIYSSNVSFHMTAGDDFTIITDVGVEPEHINARGDKIGRMLTLYVKLPFNELELAGAELSLSIAPQRKPFSPDFETFKQAISSLNRQH